MKEQYIINHLNIVRTKLNQAIKARQEQKKKQQESQQTQQPPGKN
jgi:hypothetical protein